MNFIHLSYDSKSDTCEECPSEGAVCPANSRELVVKDGYWRTSAESYVVEVCPESANCEGNNRNSSGTALCTAGSMGVLCSVCEKDYYHAITNKCEACNGSEVVTVFVVLFALIAVIFAFLVIVKKIVAAKQSGKFDKMSASFQEHAGEDIMTDMSRTAKIVLSTFQIMSSLSWQLGIVFPDPYCDGSLLFPPYSVAGHCACGGRSATGGWR